jgi:hypothetical protein
MPILAMIAHRAEPFLIRLVSYRVSPAATNMQRIKKILDYEAASCAREVEIAMIDLFISPFPMK